MEIVDLLIRWIHLIAAVVWIGGNLTMAMVIVPYFKRSLSPVERIKILTQIGKGFEPIVWGAVLVLIFSGIYSILGSIDLGASETLRPFMRTLSVKLILVLVLIILTGIHSFIMGPRIAQAIETLEPDAEQLPQEIDKMRARMAIVSSLIGVVSLLVLLAAVALRLGIG